MFHAELITRDTDLDPVSSFNWFQNPCKTVLVVIPSLLNFLTDPIHRLYEEIKQFFGFEMTVPSSQRNLVSELCTWIQMAANQAKVVVVLDALNQLDSGSGAGEAMCTSS